MPDKEKTPELILIVEDDVELQHALSDSLTGAGYNVQTANNGKEAWDLLQGACHPSLLLVDLMMPVMSGPELIGLVKSDERCAKVPIIVLSAASSFRDIAEDIPFLKKPVSTSHLLDAIRIALYLNARKET